MVNAKTDSRIFNDNGSQGIHATGLMYWKRLSVEVLCSLIAGNHRLLPSNIIGKNIM